MAKRNNSDGKAESSEHPISRLWVRGYKSLFKKSSIQIRPLTILAGANSSGKSSMMQPLLLHKQTLEASYDPGPLLLDGSHVRFTSSDQFFSTPLAKSASTAMSIGIEVDDIEVAVDLRRKADGGCQIREMVRKESGKILRFRRSMQHSDIVQMIPKEVDEFRKRDKGRRWRVVRDRCFLGLRLEHPPKKRSGFLELTIKPAALHEQQIHRVIHVPGLRGNPARRYPTAAVGNRFPGTFESYVASVVDQWQTAGDRRMDELQRALISLGLTSKIQAKQIGEAYVELRVAKLLRRSRASSADLVNIADVGFGVSQVLAVLVALIVATPGQLVYIEQPEIHLHPRARVALAGVIAEAAKRGVRVVIETHSAALLLAIQTLVADGSLPADIVNLHWFTRDPETGLTKVTSADLDEAGAFGDWPEDFADVALHAESRYLDAVEARRGTV